MHVFECGRELEPRQNPHWGEHADSTHKKLAGRWELNPGPLCCVGGSVKPFVTLPPIKWVSIHSA